MTKHSKLVSELISSILSEYIFEEENPFAADAEKEAEGGDAAAEEAPAADGGDAKKDEAPKKKEGGDEKGLTFNFDVVGVKKYNKTHFLNSTAVANKITKDGILATVQPDGVDILVGFDDITESAKKFFKKKK